MSCEEESTQANCGDHNIEFNGFFCYKLTDEEGEEGCIVFPDESENQKIALNFYNGMGKEFIVNVCSIR